MNKVVLCGFGLLLFGCPSQTEVIAHDCSGDITSGCDTPCGPGMKRCIGGYWGTCTPADVDGGVCPGASESGMVADAGVSMNGTNGGSGGAPDDTSTVPDAGPSMAGAEGGAPGGINVTDEPCPADGTCDCEDGQTRVCGMNLGQCRAGTQSCTDGKWGVCEGAVGPSDEECDGIDNDCNGHIDDGCDCRPGTARYCAGGKGVCESGRQTCDDNGYWGACVPVQAATPELCDGMDNDCDGVVDNGFALDVPCASTGLCPQTRVCSSDGRASLCSNDSRLFSAEVCDGIDNDCDGLVDSIVVNGSVQSICTCHATPLVIGDAQDDSLHVDESLQDDEFCNPTVCGPDKPRRLVIDGTCYAVCLTNSDPDGDGWGYENGGSCIVADSPRGQAAGPCPGDGVPLGMAMGFCLKCNASTPPYAMCDSVPTFDLTQFVRGEQWLKVSYTFDASGPAALPVNLWFSPDGSRRKRLPLVGIGDAPGRYTKLLRAEDACFDPRKDDYGASCVDSAEPCAQCSDTEACGSLAACGDFNVEHAWLQLAAEYCVGGTGNQQGTVTLNEVDLVPPNCDD